MRIAYIPSNYTSHRRAAQSYCRLLSQSHTLVTRLDQADLVILHEEPHDYASIFQTYHLANKYVIAIAVWEADDLPDPYKRSIQHVQEIWTPSQYCHSVFARYHPRVYVVPHVVEPPPVISEADRAHIRRTIYHDGRCFYFLTITKLWDKRKNTQLLIDAFDNLRHAMPLARLIIKACERDAPVRISDPRIIAINAHLPESQLAALYECTNAYVSPHHSEGWGLTLADAMLHQKPTIATGYSGNLEFMDESNSFLLDFEEDTIHPEDVFGLFTTRMKWAYPSREDLLDKLLILYGSRDDGNIRAKLRAAASIHRFAPSQVAPVLQARLDAAAPNCAVRS